MAEILYYAVKVVLTSGVLFLHYRLFLRDKTFHRYNRFYLLASVLVSLSLPLLRLNYFTVQVNNENYMLLHQIQQGSGRHFDHIYNPDIFLLSVALVAAFMTGRFIYSTFKILKLKERFPKEALDGVNLYMTDLEHAPFSYFKNLFWKHTIPVDSVLGRQILEHEMAHIRQRHTNDKIFMEITRSVFWFNPFFYLIRKEIHLIHEYLADKKAVGHSDTRVFAQMLLASHFSANALPATSALLSPHLKKRLTMLKTATTKFSYARKILALPLLCAIAFFCFVHAQNKQVKAIHFETLQTINGTETTVALPNTTHGKRISRQLDARKKFDQNGYGVTNIANEKNLNAAESSEKTVINAASLREEVRTRIQEDAIQVKAAAATVRKTADGVRQQAVIARQQAVIVWEIADRVRQQAARVDELIKP